MRLNFKYVSMNETKISAAANALTINGQSWNAAPATEQLCHAIGSFDLTDGGMVTIDERPAAKFRYFENLGIAILECIPESIVWRVAVYMEVPVRTRKRVSPYKPYGAIGQRPTQKNFCGLLELNGKQLRSPVHVSKFPDDGDLRFDHWIAIGTKISAAVYVQSEFIKCITFDFKRNIK